MSTTPTGCCPPFRPETWDAREITWQGKIFVKDRVRSFLHFPLNFGAVMQRNIAKIEAAGAMPDEFMVLSDENSLWGSDIYIAVSREVPGAQMSTLSGTFCAKVFEGPYKNIRTWITEMQRYVAERKRSIRRLLFYYTTCPRCAKHYGKNYVVLLAEV